MSPRQANVVTIGCLLGAVLGVLIGVAQLSDLLDFGGREAVVLISQYVTPEVAVLVLVAAVASRRSAQPMLARATVAVSGALALLALAGVAVVVGLWDHPVTAVQRTGYITYELAGVLLASLAAWLAAGAWSAQPVADPPGEAPDGGLGGGDLVGEVELDGLFRP